MTLEHLLLDNFDSIKNKINTFSKNEIVDTITRLTEVNPQYCLTKIFHIKLQSTFSKLYIPILMNISKSSKKNKILESINKNVFLKNKIINTFIYYLNETEDSSFEQIKILFFDYLKFLNLEYINEFDLDYFKNKQQVFDITTVSELDSNPIFTCLTSLNNIKNNNNKKLLYQDFFLLLKQKVNFDENFIFRLFYIKETPIRIYVTHLFQIIFAITNIKFGYSLLINSLKKS